MVPTESARARCILVVLAALGCGEVVAQPIVEARDGEGGSALGGGVAAAGSTVGASAGAGPGGGGGPQAGGASGAPPGGAAAAPPGGAGGAMTGGSGGVSLDCDAASTWPSAWAAYERDATRLINEARASGVSCAGSTSAALPALSEDATLGCVARSHAKDMAERDYFSLGTWDDAAATCSGDGDCAEGFTCDARQPDEPVTRCLASVSAWLDAVGYTGSFWGQAIAMGYSTPASVVESWLAAPDTCALLISSRADAIAVGYAQGGSYDHTWTLIVGG